MKDTSDFKTLLRQKGIRATSQRIAVLTILAKAQLPLGIRELEERSHAFDLDTTTFYRTLEMLTDAGLVRRVNLGHAHADYELVREGAHHHHLICTTCGRVEDFIDEICASFVRRATKQSSFKTITDHSVELFGLCRVCA